MMGSAEEQENFEALIDECRARGSVESSHLSIESGHGIVMRRQYRPRLHCYHAAGENQRRVRALLVWAACRGSLWMTVSKGSGPAQMEEAHAHSERRHRVDLQHPRRPCWVHATINARIIATLTGRAVPSDRQVALRP